MGTGTKRTHIPELHVYQNFHLCFNKALVCTFLVVVVFVICGFPTFFRPEKKDKEATLMTRTGGAYIPPAKLRMMQQAITDKDRYGRRYS